LETDLLATEFWSNYYKHDTQRSFGDFTDKKEKERHITFETYSGTLYWAPSHSQ